MPPPPTYYKKKLEGIDDEPLVKSSIRLVQNFPAMGPISDFCVVQREGQGVVVACCGAYRDSSLRVIRNGIGMYGYGKKGVEGCLGIQSLVFGENNGGGVVVVVLCLLDETRILEYKTGGRGGGGGAEKSLVEASRDYGMDLNTTTLSVFLCVGEKFIVQTGYQFIRIIAHVCLFVELTLHISIELPFQQSPRPACSCRKERHRDQLEWRIKMMPWFLLRL